MQIQLLSDQDANRCVYEHTRPDTGEIFYVGKGVPGRSNQAGRGRRSEWWNRIVEKAGGFNVRLLAQNISDELACLIEIERIDQLRRLGVVLCNLTNGGDGTAGHKRSAEWCAKMSAVHRGKTIPQETRNKISASLKLSGYRHPAEVLKRISAAHMGHHRNTGRVQSLEERQKRGASLKGNKGRLGQRRSASECAAVSAAMRGRKQTVIVCPHCSKTGGNSMRRWHFDACKSK